MPSPTTVLWSSVRVLTQRKWLLLAATAVTAAASIYYVRSLPQVFRATARLTAESRTTSDVLLKPTADGSPQQGYVETLGEVMRSRWLAERAATKLQIWNHPEYAPLVRGTRLPSSGAVKAPGAIVDRLMASTVVTTVPGSTVINVSFSSTDPKLAASGANALAREFIEHDLESRMSGAKDAGDFITRRLEEQRARVTETEAALQKYREQQNAASLDDRQNIVVQRLSDLNAAVTKARTERIAKEELYKRVVDLQGNRSLLDSVPAVAASAYIQQLKSQLDQIDRQLAELSDTYGELHPEIVRLKASREEASRRLNAEIGKIAESLKNEFLTAQAQEQRLDAALQEQRAQTTDLDRKAVAYATLVREAESNRAVYQSLLEQAKNVGFAGDLPRSNIRILDEATTPGTPNGLDRRMSSILALLASVVFAIGLTFLVEFLDPRLRTLEQAPQQLDLPLLGYLESIRGARGDRSKTLISHVTPARFAEQVRRIRTGVELEVGEGGVLLSISAEPNDGKTVVATNLALALASAGRRVLLIDCDLRRSNVHSAFDLKVEPGLSTALQSSTIRWQDVVQVVPNTALSVMTAGLTPANPAELLSSDTFAELLKDVRETYEWIVIDSPPLMAVSDAQLLAKVVDGVVFVASADRTHRNTARAAIQQLRHIRANVLGVVLNRVRIPRWGSSYLGHYGADYQSYYTPRTN